MNEEKVINFLRRNSYYKSLKLTEDHDNRMVFVAEYLNARPHKITVTTDKLGGLQAYIKPL